MKIIIIGGVAAGAKVAAKARRLNPNAEIRIYTKDRYVAFSACGLPYYIAGVFDEWNKLIIRSVDEFKQSGIEIYTEYEVTKIIPSDKRLVVMDIKKNACSFVEYDKLVIATGATPFVPSIKNTNLKNIFTLRTLDDGINIRSAMKNAKTITLLGGGYISVELMDAFVKNNKKVNMFEKSSFILSVFDEEMSFHIQDYILENSNNLVNMYNEKEVIEFIKDNNDQVNGLKTSSGEIYDTDMVVIASGVKPNIDLAKDAGISIGETGAIKVNSRMETNIPDIYACGDCVEKINIISNTPMWIPLGSTSNKEGRIAAINICGGVEDFEGVLGSAVLKFKDLNISLTGLNEKNAKNLGYDVVSVVITKRDKAGYMPNISYVTLKIIADRRSHRILGAQAFGNGDADKRINTISVGLLRNITVEDLLDADLTYAPPFSTSTDILISAIRILKSKLS